MDPEQYQAVIRIGTYVLNSLSQAIAAFSGNALYSSRGMRAMKQYKTVKEVCALTGLTRKHLYYFHHENVVQAAAYANYSVEGNDGYKLYDDAAVEKLQQIALYYQLGLKRNEIRDIMLDPDYNENQVLEELLSRKTSEKENLERQIAALHFLKCMGIQSGLAGVFRSGGLEALGQALIAFQREPTPTSHDLGQLSDFKFAVSSLLSEIESLSEEQMVSHQGVHLVRALFSLSTHYLGENSAAFLMGLLTCAAGNGELAKVIHPFLPQELSKTILHCIAENPGLHQQDSASCLEV